MLHLLTQPQRELQLYHKTNNNQNCRKIKLYGSLTTKDLKKPQSCRQEGGVESQRWAERHRDLVVAAEWAVPHLHEVGKN